MTKALGGDANTALTVVRRSQKFRPAADPLLFLRDGQNLISWRWSLPSPTDPVWWVSMHTISSYHGNRPTNKQTNKQTNKNKHTHKQTEAITIHCAAASLARSVMMTARFVRLKSKVEILSCLHYTGWLYISLRPKF